MLSKIHLHVSFDIIYYCLCQNPVISRKCAILHLLPNIWNRLTWNSFRMTFRVWLFSKSSFQERSISKSEFSWKLIFRHVYFRGSYESEFFADQIEIFGRRYRKRYQNQWCQKRGKQFSDLCLGFVDCITFEENFTAIGWKLSAYVRAWHFNVCAQTSPSSAYMTLLIIMSLLPYSVFLENFTTAVYKSMFSMILNDSPTFVHKCPHS